ncbi:hypothetical protein BJ123_1485 [Rhodopseudomonas thermotolerans]|uniref:Uncharacterized protein n=2 Tax=Rhodopseudomonas TaxID=1073 RepID=A0A336K1A0_9BRAD|nr:hypothetical protein BJ125_1486 [Rhodopseudomonas pentothenatexigens]REF86893.1 hypothetical protein BJ123_1485 [Rhodopseudomonas thermotolerans]SSW93684.1 hypothetical protein SAMN05892882_1486 [Rhodopseudomonas pentothenatexigens]
MQRALWDTRSPEQPGDDGGSRASACVIARLVASFGSNCVVPIQPVKQPRRYVLAAALSPRFAPVAITARGGGAPLGAKLVVGRDGLRSIAHRLTARPPAAIFWRRDRSSGRGEHGDFSRLVPSRPASRWAAAHSSGGRRPSASRTKWVRTTSRRTPRQARRRCTLQLRQTLTGRSPGRRSVPLPSALEKRPSRTGRCGL